MPRLFFALVAALLPLTASAQQNPPTPEQQALSSMLIEQNNATANCRADFIRLQRRVAELEEKLKAVEKPSADK